MRVARNQQSNSTRKKVGGSRVCPPQTHVRLQSNRLPQLVGKSPKSQIWPLTRAWPRVPRRDKCAAFSRSLSQTHVRAVLPLPGTGRQTHKGHARVRVTLKFTLALSSARAFARFGSLCLDAVNSHARKLSWGTRPSERNSETVLASHGSRDAVVTGRQLRAMHF